MKMGTNYQKKRMIEYLIPIGGSLLLNIQQQIKIIIFLN